MNWRAKALVQSVFSALPGGHEVNLVFQRHVTHGLPISDAKLDEKVELSQHHVAIVEKYGAKPVADCTFFEFGAGWDLAMPMLLYSLGVERQIIVDIRPLRRPELVFEMARRVASHVLPETFVRRPGDPSASALDTYLRQLGITYRAPADARHTDLPPGSIDAVTSTNTLEHIPADEIVQILKECRRLLSPGGVMSFQIDYQDHYSYFDPSISAYNFLRYDDRRWRWYNPSLHYQNRLRHREHLDLIRRADLELVTEETTGGTPDDLATVAALPPATAFSSFDLSELAVRRSRVTLRPRPA